MSEITVEHNPSPAKLDVLYVEEWPIWEKEESTFDWSYDQKEMCYVLDGEATITTESGETATIGPKDLVTFPEGLNCTWTITRAMRKHYILGRHF
ncbi:MAG: cupin domain-containing protein [Gammaproteobacteria bacterium]